MTNQELMIRCFRFESPEVLPVMVGILPAIYLQHREEFVRLADEYPEFITVPELVRKGDYEGYLKSFNRHYSAGEFADDWGCVWTNPQAGFDGLVTGHPLKNREDILTSKAPETWLDFLPHGFLYLRYLDLRGFEEAMIDFAEECDELTVLLDRITDFNCRQIAEGIDRCGKVVYIGDDLGMQNGLAIGPEKWVRYFKPRFARIFKAIHDTGRYVYFHTDGCIHEIMPDIYQAGADIINPQFRANGLDNLVRVCKGKIPIDLDHDRQLFPFATPAQLDEHVRECVEALYDPRGGLSFKFELGPEVALENMDALLSAARKYRGYGTGKSVVGCDPQTRDLTIR